MSNGLKVLVIEDEPDILEIINSTLRAHGHETLGILDPLQATLALETFKPDLVVLDKVMPKLNGHELVKQIRRTANCSTLPIVMVTGMNAESELLEAFNLGVDDYITKPFSPAELVARVTAVSRRSQVRRMTRTKQFANLDLVIDFSAHRVLHRGNEVPLTLTEFKLLSELALNEGHVQSRDQLRTSVLGNLHVTDRTIDVHVASLRKKLDDVGGRIITVRGIGYKLSS